MHRIRELAALIERTTAAGRHGAAHLFVLFCLMFLICGMVGGADTDYQSVQFASTDEAKTPIRGLVFRPDGAGPFAAVIGVHGCNGLFEGAPEPVEHYVFWARQHLSN